MATGVVPAELDGLHARHSAVVVLASGACRSGLDVCAIPGLKILCAQAGGCEM